jgi:hypothetical protein
MDETQLDESFLTLGREAESLEDITKIKYEKECVLDEPELIEA